MHSHRPHPRLYFILGLALALLVVSLALFISNFARIRQAGEFHVPPPETRAFPPVPLPSAR